MKFYFEHPNAFFILLPAVVAVAALVWYTYWSQSQQSFYSKFQIGLLAALRLVALICVIALLLAPAIQLYQTIHEDPLIIIATDNSESLKNYANTCEETMNKAKSALEDCRIDHWTFGQVAQKSELRQFDELRSDYSALFRSVQENYQPSSVSAMILIGDGLFNSGTDPVYSSQQLSYPVYTVGVGDTTRQTDAAIMKVSHNQSTFIGNYFPLQVDLSFSNLASKTAKLQVWEGSELLDQRNISIEHNRFFRQESFRLKADKTGIVNYRVDIHPFDQEQNTANNHFDFSIRVIDQKQKILILSKGVNPDNAALIRVLEPQMNYEYKLVTQPGDPINPQDFDLIIMNQLPGGKAANTPSLEEISKSGRPVLWLVGPQTDYSILNNLGAGFHFGELKSFGYSSAVVDADFDFFRIEDFWSERIGSWPPLQVPFTDVELSGNWQILARQRIEQIDFPRALIALGRVEGTKTALIAGEGIWKWRLYDFVQGGVDAVFDPLFLKIINYLILKPNEDNFNVYYQPNYSEDEEITITAELLDENYEVINSPDIALRISDRNGTDYDYTFDKTEQAYQLNIGQLAVGTYALHATVEYGGKQLVEEGSFRVDKLQLEQTNLQADYNTLFQISQTTGACFAEAARFDEIIEKLQADEHLKRQKFRQQVFRELIQLKWFALFIAFLLALEWFLRKYWGSY
ncbi:hypothetical protein [Mangrovibacterium marinum]|uniref:VWA domain-containing protein n=1 Tax=Mangrovibacterium marinum TaxID=1639118 RepID=A0A2T5C3M3_9BACT|nr:hypothetical protein [Mangrovibacterium marinum]PTN09336.1 hypothetical protein C8N47_105177 [Mangrovibacterium marinum]